jgi:8-oxo-dGTP diphosphatase
MSEARPRKLVVAGMIVRDGKILISQRRADQALALQWEFAGGKVEPGEAPVAALARELTEELGVGQVEIGRIWDVLFHAYPAFDLVMLCYPVRLAPGDEPRAVEVAAVVWCRPDELAGYAILPADQPLVTRLVSEGLPSL